MGGGGSNAEPNGMRYGEEVQVDAKAKGGDKIRKELNTKGEVGHEKSPRYDWAKARKAEVITENKQLTCLRPQAR